MRYCTQQLAYAIIICTTLLRPSTTLIRQKHCCSFPELSHTNSIHSFLRSKPTTSEQPSYASALEVLVYNHSWTVNPRLKQTRRFTSHHKALKGTGDTSKSTTKDKRHHCGKMHIHILRTLPFPLLLWVLNTPTTAATTADLHTNGTSPQPLHQQAFQPACSPASISFGSDDLFTDTTSLFSRLPLQDSSPTNNDDQNENDPPSPHSPPPPPPPAQKSPHPAHTTPAPHPDLHKRAVTTITTATGCGTRYSSCANLGFPQLCCTTTAVCSQDNAGNVACCPIGAACTGTVGVSGSTNAEATTTTTTSASSYSTSDAVVVATTTTEGSAAGTTGAGFVEAGGTTVAVLTNDGGRIGGGRVVLGVVSAVGGLFMSVGSLDWF